MTNEAPIFEIPDTVKARAFVNRNPKFADAFQKLLDLSNKCFGAKLQPEESD